MTLSKNAVNQCWLPQWFATVDLKMEIWKFSSSSENILSFFQNLNFAYVFEFGLPFAQHFALAFLSSLKTGILVWCQTDPCLIVML